MLNTIKNYFREILWKIGLKYIKVLAYERSFETKIPKVECEIPARIKTVSVDDLKKFPYSMRGKALKRLKDGDLGFAASVGDKIAGYLWVSFKRKFYQPELETEVSLKNEEAYLYDAFVSPVFRSKGIFKKLLEETLHFLDSRNVKKAYAYVDVSNAPSRRVFEKSNFHPTRLIVFLRIFLFKRRREYDLEGKCGHATA